MLISIGSLTNTDIALGWKISHRHELSQDNSERCLVAKFGHGLLSNGKCLIATMPSYDNKITKYYDSSMHQEKIE